MKLFQQRSLRNQHFAHKLRTISSNSFAKMSANEVDQTQKKIEEPKWRSINPDTLPPGGRYALCISAVVPRPVGVLTTISGESGVVNCAPFSYTSISSHDPPIVTHGISLPRGEKKDTLRNIEEMGEWVFNVLEVGYLEKANDTSAPLPPDMSEVERGNLQTSSCEVIKAPRLTEARLSMECKLINKYEVKNDAGAHTTTIVMGRVVRFHIREDILEKGQDEDRPLIDLCQLQPVGRAGGITYWPTGVYDENFAEGWSDRKPFPKLITTFIGGGSMVVID